ncbi:S8 family serine peptidase [Hymenobacter properus]|uniref:S8 family serine peptidase n=1 Tax=Hymenobacter properus TaxID=2791026 RepID=A0A931BIP1_9BACT|nr:S8 family serine peptidase [Hymenobacter properus]MBF9143033.1 S8 family serine peptidase [Hymenobacter properus]MBR7721841.1 S8 family serine peptidase [Microvirga sp. SRT04]
MQKFKSTSRFASLLLGGSLFAASCGLVSCSREEVAPSSAATPTTNTASDVRADDLIPGQYIIVLKDNAVATDPTDTYADKVGKVRAAAQGLLRGRGLQASAVGNAYGHVIKGFSARLTGHEAAALASDGRVAYVEQDKIVSLGKPVKGGTAPAPAPTPSTQTIPYGISRVGSGDGTGRTAWIIDTGIDLTHPDLTVDQGRSRSFLSSSSGADYASPNDGNGHGTHVAGTIAAKNNSIGVVGVAAGATVVAVRVLDSSGSGTSSGVIAGIDYVGANARVGDVANMSLGGSASQALDDAVLNASNKGILFAVAAGNDGVSATQASPARVNGANIFTVSAMDNTDTWAYFSNYGNPPVDYCMPGVNINSTWIGGSYNTISGTSMATPHMAGVLLLRGKSFTTNGSVKSDPDGSADPIAHL